MATGRRRVGADEEGVGGEGGGGGGLGDWGSQHPTSNTQRPTPKFGCAGEGPGDDSHVGRPCRGADFCAQRAVARYDEGHGPAHDGGECSADRVAHTQRVETASAPAPERHADLCQLSQFLARRFHHGDGRGRAGRRQGNVHGVAGEGDAGGQHGEHLHVERVQARDTPEGLQDFRVPVPGVARRPARGQHGKRGPVHGVLSQLQVPAGLLPDDGNPGHLVEGDRRDVPAPRRGRSGLRPEQRDVEPGRQIRLLHPVGGQGPVRAGGADAHLCRRSEGTGNPVQYLPRTVQRRQGRRGGSHQGRVPQREEQFLPEDLARRQMDGVLPMPQRAADAAGQRTVYRSC